MRVISDISFSIDGSRLSIAKCETVDDDRSDIYEAYMEKVVFRSF